MKKKILPFLLEAKAYLSLSNMCAWAGMGVISVIVLSARVDLM